MTMQEIKSFFREINFVKWAAVFLSISFCLGIGINSVAYVTFLSLGIIFTIKDRLHKKPVYLKEAGLFLICLFIFIAIREAVANEDFIKNIEKHLPFFLIPLIITFQIKRLKKEIPVILKAFLLGCLTSAVINLIFAIYRGVIMNSGGLNFWYFTYDFLAEPFGTQPIYLAFFYVFGLFILHHFNYSKKHKIFYYSTFFILTTSIFLLAARNAIICLLVLLPTYLLLTKSLSIKKALIILGVFIACFMVAIQNPVVKNRIFKIHKKGNFYSGTSLRLGVWESAYEVSKENFIWGLGKSAAETQLLQQYEQRNLTIPLKYSYNCHNQYLEFLVQYGIIGLILFLFIQVISFIRFIYHKNYLGLFWLVLFSLTALTESTLMRQWGILNFTLFISLFLLNNLKKRT